MLRATLFSAAAAFLSIGAGAASAGNMQDVTDRITGADLESALREAGLNPTMLRDKATGAPVATGQTDGMVFVVRGMDCGGVVPVACSQLVLFANFDLGREASEQDFRTVNAWNDSSVFGRAYVLEDKRQIGVDFRIDMIGGVTDDHVGGRVGRWPEVMKEFRQKMRDSQKGS